MPQGTSAP